MRGTVYTSFIFAKQPKRIRQVSSGTLHGNISGPPDVSMVNKISACSMSQLWDVNMATFCCLGAAFS